MMNAWRRPLQFQLPGPFRWRLLLDTADVQAPPRDLSGKPYTVQDRAAVLIGAVAEPPK
jgi:hypothetical protein